MNGLLQSLFHVGEFRRTGLQRASIDIRAPLLKGQKGGV